MQGPFLTLSVHCCRRHVKSLSLSSQPAWQAGSESCPLPLQPWHHPALCEQEAAEEERVFCKHLLMLMYGLSLLIYLESRKQAGQSLRVSERSLQIYSTHPLFSKTPHRGHSGRVQQGRCEDRGCVQHSACLRSSCEATSNTHTVCSSDISCTRASYTS